MERIITKTVWILLCSISLLFGSLSEINTLYKKIPYASKEDTAKILHNLENLYISAVVADDKDAIKQSLKGIIKCQKLLGINPSTYEKELAALTHDKQHTPPQKEQPKVTKEQKVSQVKTTPKTAPSVKSVYDIKSIEQKENTIVIKFDKPIQKEDMLFFEINRNGIYKDIYDLKANLRFVPKAFDLHTIKEAKIAQNRQNKVRLVLEDNAKIYSNAFIREGSLFIIVNQNPDKKSSTPKQKPLIAAKKESKTAKPTKTAAKNTSTKSASTSSVYASSKIIVIDPGHGGKDPGAVGYKKYKEKHAVLEISKLLQEILKKNGYKVHLTRDKDTFVELSDRTKFANHKNADLFISIHANASPENQKLTLKGVETFFLSPAKTEKAKRIAAKENKAAVKNLNDLSKNTLLSFLNKTKIIQSNKLAIDIQKGMLTEVHQKHKDIRDGGVREAPFWVLVGAQMPAALIEVGYITNPREAQLMFNPFYQKILAQGIADGINNYFLHNQ